MVRLDDFSFGSTVAEREIYNIEFKHHCLFINHGVQPEVSRLQPCQYLDPDYPALRTSSENRHCHSPLIPVVSFLKANKVKIKNIAFSLPSSHRQPTR
jgi:hypothetical protein